jgi:hypothetical protein
VLAYDLKSFTKRYLQLHAVASAEGANVGPVGPTSEASSSVDQLATSRAPIDRAAAASSRAVSDVFIRHDYIGWLSAAAEHLASAFP